MGLRKVAGLGIQAVVVLSPDLRHVQHHSVDNIKMLQRPRCLGMRFRPTNPCPPPLNSCALLQVSGSSTGMIVGASSQAGGNAITAGLPDTLGHSPLLAFANVEKAGVELCNSLLVQHKGGE